MRITKTQLRIRIENLNALLAKKGIEKQYELSGRYGYFALDYNNGSSTLQTGLSLKEADFIIQGMFEVLYNI